MNPYLLLLLAVACISFGSVFVRLAQAPALAIAFYRIGFASLLVAPFTARPGLRAWPTLSARQRVAVIGAGVALAAHFATWIASLSYTSIAASVLLVDMSPLFTLLFSWLILGESAGPAVLGAVALAVAGAGLIAAGDWSATGARPFFGDLLALAGAVALAAYQIAGRGLRHALPLGAYVGVVWWTAALSLALVNLALRVPFGPYPPRQVALFLALALLPTVVGHGLENWALRLLPAPVVGLFLLGEPLGASALGYAFFREVPAPLTLAGGLLVLAALALVVLRGER